MDNLFGSLAPQPRQEVRRGLFAPLVEYDDKSVEVGWPDAIMSPARSIWGMLQPGYSDEFMQRNTPPEAMKRMAGDGLNAAGFVGGTGYLAGAAGGVPRGAVGAFGARPPRNGFEMDWHGTPVQVVENPSQVQLKNLIGKTKYKAVRRLVDGDGNVYIWDGGDPALHDDVAKFLGLQQGTWQSDVLAID